MALSYPNPKNGAVVLPGTSATDIMSFDYAESQQVESVAAYGAAVYDPWRGSATPHASISAAGIAKYGASGTPPGFGSTSGGLADPDGGSMTLTIDTGVTLAAAAVVSSLRLSHSRIRGAVPLAYTLEGAGDTTVTWPVS